MRKLFYLLCTAMLCACSTHTEDRLSLSGLNPDDFVTEVNNMQTRLYTLKNKNNMEVCITNYGGRVVSVMVPDRNGKLQDVVLGFDSIADYIKYHNSYGASIGRFANRIANGRFSIDGTEYRVTTGKDGHCLHGGTNGFRFQVYDAEQRSENELILTYLSRDGEEGFPGNLLCKIRMTVRDDNSLDIEYEAETDKPTVVNMTNHSFFNLDADPTQPCLDNVLQMNAYGYTPTSNKIPTGEIVRVDNTALDFRKPRVLRDVFADKRAGTDIAQGIDLNFVLNPGDNINHPCAKLYSPKTGIALQVYTNEPGMQLLVSNRKKKSTLKGKRGVVYSPNCSVCLESQKYPDAPNQPQWPTSVLRPGEKYNSRCIYKFSVE